MKTSIFGDLATRCSKAGADHVQFGLDLNRFLRGPESGVGIDGSWMAVAGKDTAGGPEAMLTRFGRTGEEAFRRLVEDMKKGKSEK